jgi:hypothetical protein
MNLKQNLLELLAEHDIEKKDILCIKFKEEYLTKQHSEYEVDTYIDKLNLDYPLALLPKHDFVMWLTDGRWIDVDIYYNFEHDKMMARLIYHNPPALPKELQ